MFSERLKELRKKKGMTQIQFAETFNISSGTIAMWETGKRKPDLETVKNIANFFDVSIDYLLGIDKKNNANQNSNAILESIKNLPPNKRALVEKILTLNDEDFDKAVAYAEFLASQNNHPDD